MKKIYYIAGNRNNRRSECMCRLIKGRALSGPKEGVIL